MRAGRLLLTLAWEIDRTRLLGSAGLMALGYLATPLVAMVLRVFTDAVLTGQDGQAGTAAGLAVLLGVLLAMERMCAHFAHLMYHELGELVQVRLNARLFRAANDDVGLLRRERPNYADTLYLVQNGLWQTTAALEAALQVGALLVQLVAGTVLMAGLSGWFVLLPALAFVLIWTSHWAEGVTNRARERSAGQARLAGHFLELATDPATAVESRVLNLRAEMVVRFEHAWQSVTGILWRGQRTAMAIRSAGQIVFALGYASALAVVLTEVSAGRATTGDLVLVLALAVQISMQIGAVVALLAVLHQMGRTVQWLDWLASQRESLPEIDVLMRAAGADQPPGITLNNVSFAYPGRTEPALRDVSVVLPAGAVVAVVGENGSGKSTLTKVLCGLYSPTVGHMRVHGFPPPPADSPASPARFPASPVDAERLRSSVLFQDFARIELSLLESVGVGDQARLREAAVSDALDRAGAGELARELPDGLRSVVGVRYAPGVDLSGGQWQRVALARTLMRRDVDLLVLDEPASAMDALAEHELFERFRLAGRSGGGGGAAVTVFVSHRISTARMADLILMLKGGRLVEWGTHEDLLESGGLYADLFHEQASGYQIGQSGGKASNDV
nr:ABC transporter ATP-binding protein [Nonomuraea sp. K271]